MSVLPEPVPVAVEPQVSEEALRKAEQYIEEDEGVVSRYRGWLAGLTSTLLVAMSLFHMYAAVAIVQAQVLRPIHVAFMLLLVFLLFPITARFRNRLMPWDVVLALVGVATIVYLLMGGDDFWDRNTTPDRWDLIFGTAFVLLVLEAARRTSGWIMPGVVCMFIAYAFLGPYLPGQWAHRGYDLSSLVGFMYQTLEGIFGTAIDVSSTLIILFTIYGAFLQHSGAGKFYLDFSFAAMGGKPAGAGRTVVLASFLLGGPSGSGVATTVTIGTVAYPMLVKAGYGKEAAGGLLAAGGLGAIISPPVLGAAAFLIAEFLKISYFDVMLMATIPTCLYYLSLFLMVEIDTRKFGMPNVVVEGAQTLWELTRRYWYHFLSLISIVVFMFVGFSSVLSVFWATVVTFLVSFFRRDTALVPRKTVAALKDGSRQMLNVAATCAAAGIIVGVVAKTGLGLKFSAIVIDYAGGSLLLTAIYTSLIVWIVGLRRRDRQPHHLRRHRGAGPDQTRRAEFRGAHAIFTTLCAVIRHRQRYRRLLLRRSRAATLQTTLQSWEVHTAGVSGALRVRADPPARLARCQGGSVLGVAWITFTAFIGIAALAGGVQNWLFRRCTMIERALLIAAGLLLVYPTPTADWIGLACMAVVIASQKIRKSTPAAA